MNKLSFIALIGSLPFCLILSVQAVDDINPKNGQVLHQKHCQACHISMFGDEKTIYTRADHKVTDKNKLDNQVQACNQNLGLGWFDTEINDTAAWLSQEYYHFDFDTNPDSDNLKH